MELLKKQLQQKQEVEEAIPEYHWDLCDNIFKTLKGLKAHKGRMHKTTGSPIPQIDGVGDNDNDEETFCKICKECHKETKTSEDLTFML